MPKRSSKGTREKEKRKKTTKAIKTS